MGTVVRSCPACRDSVTELAARDTMEVLASEEGKKPGKKRRRLLIVLTGMSMVLGTIMLIVGAVLLAQYNVFVDFVTAKHTETAVFLLVMGILVIVISGLGQYASLKFHFCLMTTFLAVMVAVVVMEIIAGVTFFALNNDPAVESSSRKMLKKTLQRYGQAGNRPANEKAWNLIQTELQCCGLEGPEDYPDREGLPLPASCCARLDTGVSGKTERCSMKTPSLHNVGCQKAFRSFLGKKVGVLGAVAVLVALVQIAIITATSHLVKQWRIPGHCYPCY